MKLETEFKDFIEKTKLLKGVDKILLGVSGGPDSLAMLQLFYDYKDYFNIEIAAAHLDHLFRDESTAEADFVEKTAAKLNISFFRKTVNIPKIVKKEGYSAEAAARNERFKFFKKIIEQNNFDLVALAHHRDDQAETVLLNLIRGSGLKGLGGIEVSSTYDQIKIIHPLLEFNKSEILAYCQQKGLKPRFDSSNKESIYSRNIIRNEIFPIVEAKINSKAREVIARNSKLIAEEDRFLNKLAVKKYKDCLKKANPYKIEVDLNNFNDIEQVLQRRIFRHIYKKLNSNLDDLYLDHILEIEKLLKDNTTGRGIDLVSNIRVEISYSNLVFIKNDFLEDDLIGEKVKINFDRVNKINSIYNLEIEIVARNNFSFNNNSMRAAFDFDKLNLPLYIRGRKNGDELLPLGMKGHKKVKDILIDQKVPRYKRNQIPLIVDAEDNIIWLAAYKMSDKYKITNETDKVLILKLK